YGQDAHQGTRAGPAHIAGGHHRPTLTGVESPPAGTPAGFLPWSIFTEHRWSVFGEPQQSGDHRGDVGRRSPTAFSRNRDCRKGPPRGLTVLDPTPSCRMDSVR